MRSAEFVTERWLGASVRAADVCFLCTTAVNPKDVDPKTTDVALTTWDAEIGRTPLEGAPASYLRRRVRLQERTQMAYGQRNSILPLLPWEKSHLRVRREHCRFLRHSIGMRLGVIRH